MVATPEAGREDLHQLKATDPTQWLVPNPSLSETARAASGYIFSALKPFTPKSPFDQLLVDGFDAEQIWQQIDLQSKPLLATIRRGVNQLEKNPDAISGMKVGLGGQEVEKMVKNDNWKEDSDGLDEDLDMSDEDDDEEEEEQEEERGGEGEKVASQSEEEEDEGEEEDDGSEDDEDNADGSGGIEDGFLKVKELGKFLDEEEEDEEARELKKKDKTKRGRISAEDGDEEEEDEEGMEDEEDDELEEFGLGEDEDANNARYEDFFKTNKKKSLKKETKLLDISEDSDAGDEQDEGALDNLMKKAVSTHEKQLQKLQSEIKEMEKANLEPKTWTMQGEVTAAKRPRDSALYADLDFEHNVRPAPVITEEVTASLEEIIRKRILEGQFDDVQRAPRLPSEAPPKFKELDDNKSKKGLAEEYENEYVKSVDPASAPLSLKDEQKKEASKLFKKLCLKLDALSHFHFTPKPVIEDMSIESNVPALAMEEIAPVAVSDAAMLAPEEVFYGKGDIKEESELTKEERKRRRANKKRKFKAESAKGTLKKAPGSTVAKLNSGKQ